MALHVLCICPSANTADGMYAAHVPGCFWYAYEAPVIQHCQTCTCGEAESKRRHARQMLYQQEMHDAAR